MIITLEDFRQGLTVEQRDALRANLNVEAAARAIHNAGISHHDAPDAVVVDGMREYAATIRAKTAQQVAVIYE